MAIKFQYNKTSLGDLGKQLKMRQKALPTIKSKESALRSEVKKAKEAAQEFRSQLSRLEAEYDYMVSLWGEFDCDLLRIADIELTEQKIAGVRTPVLREIVYEEKPYDLFSSPDAKGRAAASKCSELRNRSSAARALVRPSIAVTSCRSPSEGSQPRQVTSTSPSSRSRSMKSSL